MRRGANSILGVIFILSLSLVLSLSLGAAVRADAPSAAPKQTLAAALAVAAPPKDSLLLAVAADKAELPADAAPPKPGDSPAEIADAYGLVLTPYRTVTALAPPTMTVLYSPPDTPNPYDGMPPGKVLKLLTRSFQPAQWKAFLSPAGIGYAEMADDKQRQIFEALFPDGKLAVTLDNPTGPNDPKTNQEFTGDTLKQARLKLGYIVSLALQAAKNPDEHVFAGGPEASGTPKRYFMTNALDSNVDHEFGAKVRETIPNEPKPGDLEFDSEALKAAVKVDGIKTVDDLVARIGTAAHLELYADPRYGTRTLTLIGTPPTARASHLLKALALCVSGTYRKVGPAYVLTNDLAGLGTRHVLWKRFEDKAAGLLPGGDDIFPLSPPNLEMPYTVQDIPWGSDPLAITPAQRKKFWADWAKNPGQSASFSMNITVPYAQLSPAQQEQAELLQDRNEKNHQGTTLDGTVMVQAEALLEITLPVLDGPVMVFQSYEGLLPYPSLTPEQEKANQTRLGANFLPPVEASAALPPSPLRPVVQKFARRAVRIAPKTAADVKRTLSALQTLGFNEVWLQITPTLKPDGEAAVFSLLTQAIQDGKPLGITVLPDLCLLGWDMDTAKRMPGLLDRAITGETTSEASLSSRYSPGNVHDTVTPFAPEVWTRLTALISQLASVPGVGGLVWEDWVTTGYEAFDPSDRDSSGDFENPLGYAEAGRLAALRLFHADPVDLSNDSYSDVRANIHLSGLNDYASSAERGLYKKWRTLRAKTREDLAHHLADALPPPFRGPTHLPLLLTPANSTYSARYGSWDDLRRPPPIVTYQFPRGPDGAALLGVAGTEQMASQLSYHMLELYEGPDASDKIWAIAAALAVRQAAHGSDRNILLNVTQKPGLLDALADTERSLTRPEGKAGPNAR